MKEFRNYINKVANQHKETVDSDAIWAGIEQKMEQPKKKRRFPPFLIWGLSLSFILLALSGLYFSKNEQNPIVKNTDLKLDIKENQKVVSSKVDAQTKFNLSKSEASQNKPENIIPSKSSKNKAYINDVDIDNNETIENNEVFETSMEVQNHQPSILPALKNNEIRNYSPNSKNTDNPKQVVSILKGNEKSTFERIYSNPQKQKNTVDIERIELDLSAIKSSLNLLYKRSKIEAPSINVFSTPRFSIKEKEQFSLLNSITIYTEYGFGSKSIQGSNEYANLRNESEKFLEQLRFGFESDLIRFLDFTLYGGLSYASINDRLIWNNTFYEDRELTYLESVRILTDGTKIENFATDKLPHLINDEALRYNSYRLISLPLGLRFGKAFSKIQIGVAFGLDLNYALSNTHTILNTDLELITVPVGDKWLEPSLHTGISVDYALSERWFLHSKITYRNIKYEHTSIGIVSKENYTIYGVGLGLKFQF